MSQQKTIPIVIDDLRGGRNGADAPLSLPETQCVEALNVDWWLGTLANKRSGATAVSTTFSSGGPFTGEISSLIRHVPGIDETAAELWAFDAAATPIVGRMAGAATFAAPSMADALENAEAGRNVIGLSFDGKLILAYNSTQNRGHIWDGSSVRRMGLATPATPTGTADGAGALNWTRSWRVRYLEIVGSNTTRRSEASGVLTTTIVNKTGHTINKPAAISEGETHWEVEYANLPAGPWYFASRIAVGTTTYDDTAATIDTTTPSPLDGTNYPPPSFKYLAKMNAHVLMAGAFETSGGYVTPKDNRVWWTPALGSTDVGDAERFATGYFLDVDTPITAMAGPLQGMVFVFGFRSIYKIIPTGQTGATAFQSFLVRSDIGCIRQQSIVFAEDEYGNACLYFLSHKGPYRIGPNGVQYLGNNIEDLWFRITIDSTRGVGHGVYHADKHQVWWWIALDGSSIPATKIVFDTRLGHSQGDEVLGGWSIADGDSSIAFCSTMFSTTVGATMSRQLKPYIGQGSGNNRIWLCDTGSQDNGTNYKAYVDTKPYIPAGLGHNCSVFDPILVALAGSGVTIGVNPYSDFGFATTQGGQTLLTAAGSETRVQKRIEGLQVAGVGVIAYRVGDLSANANLWTLDALVTHAIPQEARA